MQFCMTTSPVDFDWNQARAFLAAAEGGSFTAAAQRLHLTQPTAGRQVAALEKALGVTLFERMSQGLVLTRSGLELLDHVRTMHESANKVLLAATGQSQTVEGHVTISATDMMSSDHLPPALISLREKAPGITVEIVADNRLSDLRRREADIAVRHVRPRQPDLIARMVRESAAHFYAATGFLDRHGRPETPADMAKLDFVGFSEPAEMVDYLTAIGIPVTTSNFRIRSSDGRVAWALVRQGFGVGAMVRETAMATEGVERLLPDFPAIPVPIWLVTHRELRTSRRIRIVFDLLAEALSIHA